MDQAYPGRAIVNDENRSLLDAWSAQDPPDAWECERARRIEQIQGNANPVLSETCAASPREAREELSLSVERRFDVDRCGAAHGCGGGALQD